MTEEKPTRLRIKYPVDSRPMIYLLGQSGEIIDLSPTGVKFKASLQLGLNIGSEVSIKIVLRTKVSHVTTAYCVRKLGDLYMLQFETQIAKAILSEEYQHLVSQHGTVAIK